MLDATLPSDIDIVSSFASELRETRDFCNALKLSIDTVTTLDPVNILGNPGFEDINAAITTLNGRVESVYFSSDYTFLASITLPSNITLIPLNGACLVLNSGIVVDYYGSTSYWPLGRIFKGTGVFNFMSPVLFTTPLWWGAVADGVTDCKVAFLAAIAANNIVYVPKGTYFCSDMITLQDCSIIGDGQGVFYADALTRIVFAPGKSGFYLTGQGTCFLSKICVMSQSTGANSTGAGIIVSAHGSKIEDVLISNFGLHGLQITTHYGENANNCSIRNVRSIFNNSCGFRLDNTADSNACTFDTCDASNNAYGFFNYGAASTLFNHCHSAGNSVYDYYENGASSVYILPYSESGIFYFDALSNQATLILGTYGLPYFQAVSAVVMSYHNFIRSTQYGSGCHNSFSVIPAFEYNTGAVLGNTYRIENNRTYGYLPIYNSTLGTFIKQLSLDDTIEKNSCSISTNVGFQCVEGANKKQGIIQLVAGTITVANTSITNGSRIFLTSNGDSGTPGFVRVSSRVVGTSFTITSSSTTDTSSIAWIIFEPGTVTG